MRLRLAIHLIASFFLAMAPQCVDAQFFNHVPSAPVTFGGTGGGGNNDTANGTAAGGGGGGGGSPVAGNCTTYCPSYVSAGGVSGKRTGEDGYVATSYGPAGPLNTGYYAAPDYTGQTLSTSCPTTIASNTTYNWCAWSGPIDAAGATGWVIHGCIMYGNPSTFYHARFDTGSSGTVEYCEIRPPQSAHFQTNFPGGDATNAGFGIINNSGNATLFVNHVDIWGEGGGIYMRGGSLNMNYVWIHDPRNPSPSGDHTDGYLDNSNAGQPTPQLTVSYSTISASANTNGIGQQGNSTGYFNTNITHNYLSGWSYTVTLCGSGPGCNAGQNNVFTDNVFGDDFPSLYGVLYGSVYAHFLWRRNTWLNTPGGADSANTAAHNGKFVFPDSSFSSTDFTGT